MAQVATIVFNSERLGTNGSSPLGEPVDFDVKGLAYCLGRMHPRVGSRKVERHLSVAKIRSRAVVRKNSRRPI